MTQKEKWSNLFHHISLTRCYAPQQVRDIWIKKDSVVALLLEIG